MRTNAKLARLNETTPILRNRLAACDICPRDCRVNRLDNQTGFCGAGSNLTVYTAFLHQGEEPGLCAKAGSGTIFFSGCNLKCLYCQNYKFSHTVATGTYLTEGALARIMINLQKKGASNINLVTPTHFLP